LSPEYWYFFGLNFDPEFMSFDTTNLVLPSWNCTGIRRQPAAVSTAASTSARLPMRDDENAVNIDN
jgi:hypothetical protein